MLKACVDGYSDSLFDQQILSVQAGYWAGYYNRMKKPKPIKSVIDSLVRNKSRQDASGRVTAPEVDVDAFLEQEAQFQKRLNT